MPDMMCIHAEECHRYEAWNLTLDGGAEMGIVKC